MSLYILLIVSFMGDIVGIVAPHTSTPFSFYRCVALGGSALSSGKEANINDRSHIDLYLKLKFTQYPAIHTSYIIS